MTIQQEMATPVNSLELRYGVHELLRQKEEGIKHLRAQHNATLRELYLLVSRPNGPASSFHDVGLEDETAEERMAGFEAWKADYPLEKGSSSIEALRLPELPPLSPPPDATVFPDEPAATEPQSQAISPNNTKRHASPFSPHAGPSSPKRPRTRTPLPPTPPPDSPVQAVAPRDVFQRHRSFSPVHKINAPEWIPQVTYQPVSTPPDTPPSIPMPLSTAYTAALPPLPPVPTAQPSRRIKKKDDKQGITKLYTQFAINPLSDTMSQSSKCVLTSDWRVAAQELRHIRAMERIEAKKAEHRWSLRQPKKVKSVPVVKAHWDYLLEEMQWLKVDYAEERRWKRMLALEVAYQIVEWHLATSEEKAEIMVGQRGWGAANNHAIPGKNTARSNGPGDEPNSAEDDVEMMILPEAEETGADGRGAAGEVLDSIMDEKEKDKKDAESKEVEKLSADKLQSAEDGKSDAAAVAKFGAELEVDMDAEGEADADGEEDAEGEADADGEVDDTAVEGVVGLADIPTAKQADTEAANVSAGAGDAEEEDKAVESSVMRKDTVLPNGLILNRRFANVDELMVARKPLLNLSLTEAAMDLGSLPIPSIPASSAENGLLDPPTPPLLTDLFPDLAVYDGPQPPEDGKTPKRMDEGYTSASRIAHTSRIMDIRPVFVSTIKPAQNTFEGDWDLSVGAFYEDPRGSTSVGPEVLASTSSVFSGRGIRPPNASHVPMQQTPAAQHLRPTLIWTDEEEKTLMRLIATYPYNWSLIADSFNSEIVVIPTEKRSAFDCWEKWYWKWGPAKGQQRPDQNPPNTSKSTAQVPPSAGPPSSTLTPLSGSASTAPPPSVGPSRSGVQTPAATPGGIAVPTLPPSSAGGDGIGEGIGEAPPPPGLSKREARAQKNKYEGSKKAIRHQVLYDTMRRISRRRDQSKQKASQQPPRVINVHESHATYHDHAVSTPWELVEMKYQRDMAGLRARQQRVIQDSQSEIIRQAQHQQLLAAQMQQGQAPPSVRSSSQSTPRMATNGQGLPHMTPNQQQLLSAVAAANAAHSRQSSSNGPAAGSPAIRAPPTPQQQPMQLAPPGQQQQQQGIPIQSTQVQAQMQMLQAQQLAAQSAQAQAQVQATAHARNQPHQPRNASNGDTPMSQPQNISSSPYPPPTIELPNGQASDQHVSPAMHPANSHSSPSQPQGTSLARVPGMALAQAQHLRVPSAGSQGSPQMAPSVPAPMLPPPQQQQQQQAGSPNISPQMLQLIVTQLNQSGQQVTPESIRTFHVQMLRQAQANQAAQQQQQQHQQQQQQQMGPTQGPGPPQIPVQAGQGVPQFARSPGVQPGQTGARNSPKPNT